MQNLSIQTSLDWQKVRTTIEATKRELPMFRNDVFRFLKHIDAEVTELSKLELAYRTRKSARTELAVLAQADKINNEIKRFHQYYMLALMANS